MHSQLPPQIEKARDYLIIVEGKKDMASLEMLEFKKIFVLNETGKSLGERIEKIQELCSKKDKVCILTDFDKKGRKMYQLLKSKLLEAGVRLDNSFRAFLLREKLSHIEGLSHFVENGKIERENKLQ